MIPSAITTITCAAALVSLGLTIRYGWLRFQERRNTRHHVSPRRAIRWEQE